jgi:hypothetical protein
MGLFQLAMRLDFILAYGLAILAPGRVRRRGGVFQRRVRASGSWGWDVPSAHGGPVPRVLRDEEIIHPYLAPAAAIVQRWHGRESLHAGAFVAGAGAWALLGERESGKSSTLAYLSKAGHEIVTDDMLIFDGQGVFFGPRSVDLRREAADYLGTGAASIGMTGARERWRLDVAGGSTTPVPLIGCVFLEWADRLELVRLSGSERLERLFAHRGVRLPPTDPTALLGVAALDGFELRRPSGWDSLDDAMELLLDRVG